MPVVKQLLCPERLRRIPDQFSWVDHRLVRHKHICQCGPMALALYLFLVTVGDAQGVSFYGDATVARLLTMHLHDLERARHELVIAGLIAYQKPLYQILDLTPIPNMVQSPFLPPPAMDAPRMSNGQPEPVSAILRRLLRTPS